MVSLQLCGGLERQLSLGDANQPPLLPHTIPEHFGTVVSRFGDRPAVICRSPTISPETARAASLSGPLPESKETTLTFEALDLASNALAHSLRNLGVKKGDRVAVSLGNTPEFATLTYAIFKLGAILVPLNPAFNCSQLSSALSHLGVELLIIGAVTDLAYKPCRGRSNLPLLESLVPDLQSHKVESPLVPSLRTIVLVDNTSSHPAVSSARTDLRALTPFAALGQDGSRRSVTPDAPLSPHETINIQFTSGTTSQPKAAMLSHRSILNNGALVAHRMGLTPADRVVCPPPLFHCAGSVLGYMATATTGCALLLPSPAFDPRATLRMAADGAATSLYGVNTMFVALLEALAAPGGGGESGDGGGTAPPPRPRHLARGMVAGSTVPPALLQRVRDGLGLGLGDGLVICYGMTETSPVSCMTTAADPAARRARTVGRAMPHTAVKIVDPRDRSRVLPVGRRGELAAAGYLVMGGYWGDEARTREVRVAGDDGRVWLFSGDEAVMDPEGYVSITGRIKDLIIRGGENIHPLEIENVLLRHRLVGDVSVVGVPDERHDEEVAAFVLLDKGARGTGGDGAVEGDTVSGLADWGAGAEVLAKEDLRRLVGRHLSSHLMPKYVFWIDDFPKTTSGKIQKYRLRDMARNMVVAS